MQRTKEMVATRYVIVPRKAWLKAKKYNRARALRKEVSRLWDGEEAVEEIRAQRNNV